MSPCRNCGNINTPDAIFCRTCGTKLASSGGKAQPASQFEMPAPGPYSWKTGEFATANEARSTMPITAAEPAPLVRSQRQFATVFRCPNCGTHVPPLLERKVSTAGWVTFAILLVVAFPLFWIGLLIREDVPVCQICQTQLALGPYR